jgi:glycosyltransferase involved in cell wall biosynthesis
MTERPLVSVIMPAYNTSAYVAAAIRSARSQTIQDVEILVVDDGSTDGTRAAAERAADGDQRVVVLTQANAGPSAARNHAMKLARGEYFAFLDSDDEWMPSFLEAQLAVLARRPSTAVVTGNAFNRGGVFDGTPYRAIQPAERALPFVEMIAREDSVCILSVFRRSVYDTIGDFEESLRGNEDYEFWLRAAQHGFEFVQTFTPLAYYRRRPDSASADDRKMAAGILLVFGMIRGRCRGAARAAVDLQIAYFERELLSIEARYWLRQGDSRAAARCYEQLFTRTHDTSTAALLFAARHAPWLLLWAASVKRRLRRMTQKGNSFPTRAGAV